MSGWRYVRPVSSGGVPVLSIAPLWRRLLASFLNGVVVLGGIGGIAGVVTAGWRLVRRLPAVKRCLRSARLPSRLTGWARPGIDLRPPVRWIRAVWMATVVGAVVGRNWRGPGGRILQVRRVDARTGGSVTVRSALIAFAATAGWKRASARFYASRRGSADERLSALQPTLKELQQAHRDDPDALNRAMIDLYRTHDVNPLGSCRWQLPGLLLPQVPALLSAEADRVRMARRNCRGPPEVISLVGYSVATDGGLFSASAIAQVRGVR